MYKPGVYAIPYEGEEVKLHWANRDQYYIKTSEYLRDYAFRLQPGSPSTSSGQAGIWFSGLSSCFIAPPSAARTPPVPPHWCPN